MKYQGHGSTSRASKRHQRTPRTPVNQPPQFLRTIARPSLADRAYATDSGLHPFTKTELRNARRDGMSYRDALHLCYERY